MACGLITSWEIDGETVETVADFIFLSSKITAYGDCSHEIKRPLLLGRKAMTNLDNIKKQGHLVQFSHSVVSDSLQPHELQHTRLPYPSPTPGVHPNSCPSSWWCHPAISSSVVPVSSCPQYLPAAGSFPMSQLFAWGGQNIGVSASTSVLPMNIQDWFPLRDSQESSPTPQFKSINSLVLSFLHCPTLTSIHDHWENHSLD